MKITLVGTGTSHGVPVIACKCPTCTSADPRDNRMRTSAFITASDGTIVIIDTSPEFRIQSLRFGLEKVDAVLLTHSHADHLHGLDDLRIFSHTHKKGSTAPSLPALGIYANRETLCDVENRFDYVFRPTQEGGGKPLLQLLLIENYSQATPLHIGSLEIVPVPIKHGTLNVCGWKITDTASPLQSFAYITDCSFISDDSIALIRGAKHCVIDSLRERPHTTHFCFAESLEYAQKIGASHTWLTHICHDFSHAQITNWFDERWHDDKRTIAPAYDRLELEC